MQNDFKIIKRKYGENFAKLCRTSFPTLLEQEGFLPKLLEENFYPTRFLYEDLMADRNLLLNFKNYIYLLATLDEIKKKEETVETPEKLFDKAGYKLYKCETNEDVLSFKKYYKHSEELCTFRDPNRINKHYIFWAVKKNVKDIIRANFTNPMRQDEYGTSVISIQFEKGPVNYLSIKNRYNHTVLQPDATFSNDLENIYPGLTKSFEKHYGIHQDIENKEFSMTNYVKDVDGRFFRYNGGYRNVFYCVDNYIVNFGVAQQYDKVRYELVDYFIIDKKEKTITMAPGISFHDSFLDAFTDNIDHIDTTKLENERKLIRIHLKDKTYADIVVNKYNQMVEYTNNNIKTAGRDFLLKAKYLEKFSAQNLQKVSFNFMPQCESLKELNIPNIEEIGDFALEQNVQLTELNAPKLKKVGDCVLKRNVRLKAINLPSLEIVGDYFLQCNQDLKELDLPSLEIVGDYFLHCNRDLKELDLPNLKVVGNLFMCTVNCSVENIYAPNLKKVGTYFLTNSDIKVIRLDKLKECGAGFLSNSMNLEECYLNSLTKLDDMFLMGNRELKVLEAKEVKSVGNNCFKFATELKKVDLPKATKINKGSFVNATKIETFNVPRVKNIKHLSSINPALEKARVTKKYSKKKTLFGILFKGKDNQTDKSK